MAEGWSGEKVRLVAMEKEKHFELVLSWIRDPEVTQWLAHPETPMSRPAEEAWFDQAIQSSTDCMFAVELLDGTPIGVSALHAISYAHGFAITGSYIASPAHRNKGYGTDAAIIRAHYAFEVLGLRLLQSGYIAGNLASKSMQAKLGSREIGVLPGRFWKRGKYRDEVLTVLTRDEFWAKHGQKFVHD